MITIMVPPMIILTISTIMITTTTAMAIITTGTSRPRCTITAAALPAWTSQG